MFLPLPEALIKHALKNDPDQPLKCFTPIIYIKLDINQKFCQEKNECSTEEICVYIANLIRAGVLSLEVYFEGSLADEGNPLKNFEEFLEDFEEKIVDLVGNAYVFKEESGNFRHRKIRISRK